MRRNSLFFVLVLILLVSSLLLSRVVKPTPDTPAQNVLGRQASPSATPQAKTVPTLGERTKIDNCRSTNALPDPDCTPGTIFFTATKEQVCISGYSKSVRNVSESVKNQVYAEYGISSHKTGEYEVDHLISLELGGSNDIANLWPEPANPTPGFHEKDKVENYLHNQVCNGTFTLAQAQEAIATNWLQIYQQIPH
ncbi:HNH endonuclease [Patescibacteria group bacterium]|nr:HNH endonuclease [Patescibacteria group bacterium]MCL5409801.1 HNH endonuclease [Patescibacteria group bacterium]